MRDKSNGNSFRPFRARKPVLVDGSQGVALRALPWAIVFHAFSVRSLRAFFIRLWTRADDFELSVRSAGVEFGEVVGVPELADLFV